MSSYLSVPISISAKTHLSSPRSNYFYFYNSGSLIPSSCIFRLRMSPLIDAYIMGSITYRLLPPPIPRNFIFRWGVESFRERPITRFGRSSDIFSRKRLTNSQLAVFRRDIFFPPTIDTYTPAQLGLHYSDSSW